MANQKDQNTGSSPANNISDPAPGASTGSGQTRPNAGGGTVASGNFGGSKANTTTTPSTGGTDNRSLSTPSQGGTAAAPAKTFIDQAKETAGHAYEVVADKATEKLEEQKSTLSGGLVSVADTLRKVGNNLKGPDVQDGIAKYAADYSDTAARKIQDAANYFEQKDLRGMYTDVENFARRNPAVFVGGAFALGLLAARFEELDARQPLARRRTRS